ncbi:MAG: hypothetical protein JO114_03500 [Planctomycetaceae bacterium]|nr:hypothetical protein [Planctomycetaceae bacterium]
MINVKATDIMKFVNAEKLLKATLTAITTQAVDALLAPLPIVPEPEYRFNPKSPSDTWQEGKLQWYPVGADRGNAGRIKLAGAPENPIGERIVNSIEAIIELARQMELQKDRNAPPPPSPREAVRRYFNLPPLDELPQHPNLMRGDKLGKTVTDLANRIRVQMRQESKGKDYTVIVEDDGIGQRADRMHETLLSLGLSDKPDKPYLIGMFGQGGSSAFGASIYSWFVSRRAPELSDHEGGGIGWTVVRQVIPVGRRDVYWAYLAAHPDGRVPRLPESAAEANGIARGTRIGHVGYKFATSNQAYGLYYSLNHLLFNPVLPYYVFTRGEDGRGDPMTGNAYRLSKLKRDKKDEDKRIENVTV